MRLRQASAKRRPAYRVATRVIEEGGRREVVKAAAHPEAAAFLEEIPRRERLAEDFFGRHARVVRGTLRDGRIHYPLVAAPSLEDRVAQAIDSGDPACGLSWLEEYLGFLRDLPTREDEPVRLLEEIGAPNPRLSGPVHCFTAAPLDCIPRNILVSEEGWYVVDHEWMFELPMPFDLLVYLGVSSLVVGLQDRIRAGVSEERPVALFAGRRNRLFVPYAWLETLHPLEIPLSLLNQWSCCFQRKVLVRARPRRLRLRPHPPALRRLGGLRRLLGGH